MGLVFDSEINISGSKSENNLDYGVIPQILLPLRKEAKFSKMMLREPSVKGNFSKNSYSKNIYH